MVANPLLKYIKMNFKAIAEYKADFLAGGLSMLMTNAIFFGAILYIAKTYSGLGGLTYDELLMGLTIGDIAFVLGMNFFAGFREFQDMFISGEFDKLLIRPLNPYIHLLMHKINPYSVGEIATAIILIAMNRPQNIPLILLFSVPSAVILHFSLMIYNLIPLFLRLNTGYSMPIFDVFITSLIYPPSLFGDVGKFLMLYIVPGGLAAFGPVYVLRNPSYAGIYLALAIIFPLLFFKLFDIGLRRYESAS